LLPAGICTSPPEADNPEAFIFAKFYLWCFYAFAVPRLKKSGPGRVSIAQFVGALGFPPPADQVSGPGRDDVASATQAGVRGLT